MPGNIWSRLGQGKILLSNPVLDFFQKSDCFIWSETVGLIFLLFFVCSLLLSHHLSFFFFKIFFSFF